MVLPGKQVDPQPKRRRVTTNSPSNTPIGRRLAQLEALEAQAPDNLVVLEAPEPQQVAHPGNEPVNQLTPPEEEQQDLYDAFMPLGGAVPAEAEDNPAAPLYNRDDYYRSRTYQEHILQESNWRKVIPAMFLSFMPCSRATFEWADPILWNHDMNVSCNCALGQKSTVTIDTIDWTGCIKIQLVTCTCTPDAVWLLRRGLIGGTPTKPRTAFSIRLLQFHHIVWKYCSVRLAPFVEAVEEYLDPQSILLLVAGSDQTCDWRTGFSSAVDVYREMLQMRNELAHQALQLSPEGIPALTCPACFGPEVPGKREAEPNVIICLDANFQQRRHISAMKTWETKMKSTNKRKQADVIHPCSDQHTAADDIQGRHTWKSYYETGLMGMGCRPDHILKFINIIQMGERGHFPVAMLDWLLKQSQKDTRYGVLYDIGCNMENGILNVHIEE
ncbi:hypothetical protein DFH28DRAFT_1082161 [Melampsora americana]|nr:hypothetical protein DFH28DRAFT_1082161 [Melampsora americana]